MARGWGDGAAHQPGRGGGERGPRLRVRRAGGGPIPASGFSRGGRRRVGGGARRVGEVEGGREEGTRWGATSEAAPRGGRVVREKEVGKRDRERLAD